ncbi:hypothetical protein G938_02961 [Escherichia coli UMEA 3200-1]|uniref:prophage tail fiber N-terminal domain-containing protein n=1 Tax=Escherichia coli TaxID=562 RepID=UPI000390AB9F|nr:prophage tail fiber N-terminal domain-containing protein [Escherichia coli]EQX85984.1 hypothetical protein G938_02961 [Escherichia coli UMEA 3200-1]
MSVLISGALINGAGVPMAECKIYLDALVNTSEVVTESFAVIETDVAGQYAFEAPKGKYTVHIKQKNGPKCCVGDISVYDDSKPGTLNDFLTALDESDLKPDVVKRFEELAQQAQQSAEAAAESEQASDTARSEAINAAKNARLHRNAASSAATSAEQSANVALGRENNAAEYARQAKASQDASAGNAQEAKQHRDEAQRIVDDLKGSNASTTEKGLVQLCSDTDNDSEELAATPKAVKAVMDETKTKAPLDSPAFTGTPTTPTPPDDAAGLETANAAFVRKLLAALVGSSPEALDTLNELAAALGHDPNFATTVTKALAGKQPLNDVLTAVSQITPEENTLPYFSAEGRILLAQLSEKARALLALDTPEAMRTELELKAAATMEPQTDIRDRTPGRLALPGAFGFGKAFSNTEALAFNGQADFAEWLKEATPGRYAVSIADSSTLLAGTTKFNGIIDVMWSPFDNDESDAIRKFKTLLCFNQYYEGEHSIHRLTYRWSGNNWNATVSPIIYDGDSLAFLLSRTAGNGPSSYYKYPAVGSLILAVYQGTAAGDKEIKIGLGDVVAGSRLGPVAIDCAINNSGTYVSTPSVKAGGAGAFSFPGRYQALSGYRATYGDRGFICLFVRIE